MSAQAATKLLSFEEYLEYAGDPDTRYELVEGGLAPMSPPTLLHVLIVEFLHERLKDEIRRLDLPWLCLREVGVRTGLRKSRLMDLCLVETVRAQDLLQDPAVFQDPPLLAVEVVSQESATRDYRYKRSEYAAVEIPEYWIIDPITDKVTLLTLVEGLYEAAEFSGDQTLRSGLFPGLTLTAGAVLSAGTARVSNAV